MRPAPGDPASVREENGKYQDKDGNPTYNVKADGTVDWYTYSGYRRYHSDCHVCHGPDGEGSSYAPALSQSLKNMDYGDFLGVVASGRKNVSSSQENVIGVIFGDNPNVACYMDDLCITSICGRAPPTRCRADVPQKHDDKLDAAKQAEDFLHGPPLIAASAERRRHCRTPGRSPV